MGGVNEAGDGIAPKVGPSGDRDYIVKLTPVVSAPAWRAWAWFEGAIQSPGPGGAADPFTSDFRREVLECRLGPPWIRYPVIVQEARYLLTLLQNLPDEPSAAQLEMVQRALQRVKMEADELPVPPDR